MPDNFLAVYDLPGDDPPANKRFRAGNVKVKHLPRRVTVSGSLTKLAQVHNAATPTRDDVVRALDILVAEIGPEVLDAKVFVLEFGVVIETEQEAALYLQLLAKVNRKKRVQFGETTVSFGNKNARIVFYDKTLEMAATGEFKPADLVGKHLLRIEFKLLRRIKRQLGRPLFLKDLADPVELRRLVAHFLNQYDQVEKPSRATHLKAEGPTTPKRALDEFFARLLHNVGMQEITVEVRSYRSRMGPDAYQRFRKKVFALVAWQPEYLAIKDELDAKVNAQCARILQSCITTNKESK